MSLSADELYAELRRQFFYGSIKEEKRQNALFEPLGINYSTFRCLLFLRDNPNGAEPSKMGDELIILRQTITSIVDQLDRKGLVERLPHPTDRRRILVKLLPEGLDLANKAAAVSKEYYRRITSYFTEEEMDEYIATRNRMCDVRDEVLESILAERE